MASLLGILINSCIFIPLLIDKIQGDYVNMIAFIASCVMEGFGLLTIISALVKHAK